MGKFSLPKYFHQILFTAFLFLFIVPGFSGNTSQDSTKNKQLKQRDTAVNKLKASQASDTTKTQKSNIKPGDSIKQISVTPVDSGLKENPRQRDSILNTPRSFDAEDLTRGERLFYGLAYPKDISINCSSCHNTRVLDTLNWNPDALEISRKYLELKAADLNKVLLKPVGKKMSQVHKGFQLTAEDIVLIKGFMDKFVNIGLKKEKPVLTNLLLLIISAILFLLATIDIIIKRIFRKRWINWAILSVTGVIITWILAVNAINFGRSKGYAPEQPIKFSHAVHAGQNKIDCIYCHYTAKLSKTAGIPPVGLCMNCHLLVRTGTRSGVTEINKVVSANDNKQIIKWVRIYRLPDFVFFSHAQHVNAGKINCTACHGDVKNMHRLYQVPTLGMGWCIDCHDTRAVNISNKYYRTYYPTFLDSIQAGKIDSIRVVGIGGRDCGKCHY
jgi:hypothetical protein